MWPWTTWSSGYRTQMHLPPPNSTVSLELQGRVKAVTLQGWADSTHTMYSTGLLIYHVFCNHSEIPEVDHALTSAMLISSFISMLMGSLLSKAIRNYIYGIRAWHTLHGLPWALHEDQIVTMLKGAAKLTPLAIKQDQCKPVTIQMMTLIKAKLNQTDPFNLAFFACLTTIFYMAA